MARTVGSRGVETAARVLEEAGKLFALQGYAAVSMRQIASACGLQVGALYNHFPTKQSILHEMMVEHMNSLLVALEAADIPEEPEAALEAFIRFHIRYHIDKPKEVFIAYMELRNLEPEPYREILRLRQKYERKIRSILRDGKFAIDDVPVTGMAIIGMMTGVSTSYRFSGRLSPEEVEEIYVNLVRSLVGLPHKKTSPMEELV